jgi:hypothetical protein
MACRACAGWLCRDHRPRRLLEELKQISRHEAGARGINVFVALCVLAMDKETLRDDEMKIVFGARHRNIEEAALLLDLGGGASANPASPTERIERRQAAEIPGAPH